MPAIEVPVIGVFYDEIDHVDSWFESVMLQNDESVSPIPIIVLNNSPHGDRLVELLRARMDRGELSSNHLEKLPGNEGHTAGINRALELLLPNADRYPWLVTLDPDSRLAPKALRNMLESAKQRHDVDMITPLVLEPLGGMRNYQSDVEGDDRLVHAGHYPLAQNRPVSVLSHRWRSYFIHRSIREVRDFLTAHDDAEPFSICFCAGMWRTEMFRAIGLPNPLQFRTLNCGEICYRARLRNKKACFSPEAIAFHKPPDKYAYDPGLARSDPTSNAFHYYHAQYLIDKLYLPDSIQRSETPMFDPIPHELERRLRDLDAVMAIGDDVERQALYDRVSTFSHHVRPL